MFWSNQVAVIFIGSGDDDMDGKDRKFAKTLAKRIDGERVLSKPSLSMEP